MPQARPGTRRLGWLLATILGVAAVHGWLTWSMAEALQAQRTDSASDIKRMEASYVSELKLSTPPVAARPAPKPVVRRSALAKSSAIPPEHKASEPPPSEALASTDTASAPASSASESVALAATTALVNQPPPEPPAHTESAPRAPVSFSAQEPAQGPPFVWPLATRVSYKLTGYYRGDVYGHAKVEWVRQDLNYQVRVDTTIGPSFAPIRSSNLTSAGVITPEGLSPLRFEQVDKLLIKSGAPRKIQFDADAVVLSSGERVPRTPGLQDAASQFIQLSYQFIMNPALLTPGNVVQMPVALPKKLETIAYEVIDEQDLDTPIGKVPTFHVRPRRMSADGGVLPVEIWFAPGLQYLPVRILVKADDNKSFMDLRMERAPEQSPAPADAAPVAAEARR